MAVCRLKHWVHVDDSWLQLGPAVPLDSTGPNIIVAGEALVGQAELGAELVHYGYAELSKAVNLRLCCQSKAAKADISKRLIFVEWVNRLKLNPFKKIC